VILLVDIGNSRIKWRCLNAKRKEVARGGVESGLVVYSFLEDMLRDFEVETIYLSNVGHQAALKVFNEYTDEYGLILHIVESQKTMCGLLFAYENIERLGVDRCLAMIGAYKESGVLVIDAGSAITADYLNKEGEHLGGYILPGYEMSRKILLGKTAKIGVMANLGSIVLGTNTESCVNNGFAMLYTSLLEGFIKYAKALGIDKFVVTGGDAFMLKRLSTDLLEYHENLVLDGLQKYSLCYGFMFEGEI
jgi:type III pantothenate kinase